MGNGKLEELSKKEWWENMTYQESINCIGNEIESIQESFVSIGFSLRSIRDKEQYKEDGYKNISEFAQDKFGMSPSATSRWIAINEKFSKGGNSPFLDDKYKDFSKSKLQEMLTMNEDQLAQVDPSMTRNQIREIKNMSRETEDQIPGQDSILDHPEMLPEEAASDPAGIAASMNPPEDEEEEIPDKLKCFEEYVKLLVPPEIIEELRTGRGINFRNWMYGNKIIPYTETTFGWMHGTGTHLVFEDTYKNVLYKCPWFEVPKVVTTELFTNPEKADAPAQSVCIHRNGYNCTLTEAQKIMVGDGEECYKKCCWNCEKHGHCGYECNSSATRPEEIEKVEGEVVYDLEEKEQGEKEISPYGSKKSVYPAGSLIATEGCGNKHYCFNCSMICGIRQKDRQCRYSNCGNPKDCETVKMLQFFQEKKIQFVGGEHCLFLHPELAEKTAGTGEPIQCCALCQDKEDCMSGCSVHKKQEKKTEQEKEEIPEKPENQKNDEYKNLEDLYKKWKNRLEEAMALPVKDRKTIKNIISERQILTDLLGAAMEKYKEKEKQEEHEQPDLPVFRNDSEREAWLKDYKAWGIWYKDNNIDAIYYKFDFKDGSRLVVAEYPDRDDDTTTGLRTEHHMHFQEKGRKKYTYGGGTYDRKYMNATESVTYMKNWLKEYQKRWK